MTPAALAVTAAVLFSVGALVVLAVLGAGRLRRASMRPGELMLAGKRFVHNDRSSVADEEYFTDLVERAGITDPDPHPGEDPIDYGQRIYRALHNSRTLRPMVACLIRPARAKKWTPAIAVETEKLLGDLDEPADKERFRLLVAETLIPFYRRELSSWSRSLGLGAPIPTSPSPGSGLFPAPGTSAAGGR